MNSNYIVRFISIVVIAVLALPLVVGSLPKGSGLLGDIHESFAPKAFAEFSYYGGCNNMTFDDTTNSEAGVCVMDGVVTQSFCAIPGITSPITAHAYRFGYGDTVINNISATQSSSVPMPIVGISPSSVPDPANYLVDSGADGDGNPWELNRVDYTFDVTIPAVTQTVTVPIDIAAQDPSGGTNTNHAAMANLHIIVPNQAPTLTNLSPANTELEVASGEARDIPVSARYDDPDGNSATLTFELSGDNFATIDQSIVVTDISDGDVAAATFNDLGAGSYNWRVTAVEERSTLCDGAVMLDPEVNLRLAALTVMSPEQPAISIASGDDGSLAQTGSNISPYLQVSAVIMIVSLPVGMIVSSKLRR